MQKSLSPSAFPNAPFNPSTTTASHKLCRTSPYCLRKRTNSSRMSSFYFIGRRWRGFLEWILDCDSAERDLKGLCYRRSSFGAIGVTSMLFWHDWGYVGILWHWAKVFKSVLLEIAFGELDQLQLVPSGGDSGPRRDLPATIIFLSYGVINIRVQLREIKCMELVS
jgi:hypothetical protein